MSLSLTFKLTNAHAALKQEDPAEAESHTMNLTNVDSEHTILDLKYKLAEKADLYPDEYRLICKGKILRDEDTMLGCGLESSALVYIVLSSAPQRERQALNRMSKTEFDAMMNDEEGMEERKNRFEKMMRSNKARKDPWAAVLDGIPADVKVPEAGDLAEMMDSPQMQAMMQQMLSNPKLCESMFADGAGEEMLSKLMGPDGYAELAEKVQEKIESVPGGMEAMMADPMLLQALDDAERGAAKVH